MTVGRRSIHSSLGSSPLALQNNLNGAIPSMWEVFRRTADALPEVPASGSEDRSVEYWAGWIMAYYQWYSGLRFSDMAAYGLTAGRVCRMYILHEADVLKFVDAANAIIRETLQQNETN